MSIAEAVAALRAGGLVAFPTETVFGLGADASNPDAVARLFEAKGRPPERALTVMLAPEADFAQWARWSTDAALLADRFWPGPLTLVLPRQPSVPDIVTGGQPTVGLRVPDHPVTLALLRAFAGGIVAPSANLFGQPPATDAETVRATAFLRPIEVVLDGACDIGVASTVFSLPGRDVLRRGALDPAQLIAALDGP